MVTHNEANGPFERALVDLESYVDAIFVFDDQSDDTTLKIAQKHGVASCRSDEIPTFMEHEGQFRAAAWEEFIFAMTPESQDWILAIDADEFLVTAGDKARVIRDHMDRASIKDASITVARREVWEQDGNRVRVREDGYWQSDDPTRLFRFQGAGNFLKKAMGCGSCPTYVMDKHQHHDATEDITMYHFGYATPELRQMKHQRYTSLEDHGHNPTHINSILAHPRLSDWRIVNL